MEINQDKDSTVKIKLNTGAEEIQQVNHHQ